MNPYDSETQEALFQAWERGYAYGYDSGWDNGYADGHYAAESEAE